MTIEELIESLREYDPEAEVMLSVMRPDGDGKMLNVAEDIHGTETSLVSRVGYHWLVVDESDADPDETRDVVLIE